MRSTSSGAPPHEQLALYELLATAEHAAGPMPQLAERTLAGST